jgi:ketosteroid isomerase-like protein
MRTGFIRCSGRIGPRGSHQFVASAENFSISAGETLPGAEGGMVPGLAACGGLGKLGRFLDVGRVVPDYAAAVRDAGKTGDCPMTQNYHQLVRDFFTGLSIATLRDEVVTPDLTVRSVSSPASSSRDQYQAALRMLQSLFQNGLTYSVVSIIVEGERAVAEVTSQGVFKDGEVFGHQYAFVFQLRDGRIAAIKEYFDTVPIREKLMPRMRALGHA